MQQKLEKEDGVQELVCVEDQWKLAEVCHCKKAISGAKKSNHYWVLDEQLDTKVCEKNIYRLVKMYTKMTKDIEHYMHVKHKVDINWQQHFDKISNVEYLYLPIPDGLANTGPITH